MAHRYDAAGREDGAGGSYGRSRGYEYEEPRVESRRAPEYDPARTAAPRKPYEGGPSLGRRKALPEKEGAYGSTEQYPSQHLWVGNVTSEYTEDVLLDCFGRYGEVDSVSIIAPRNYAFVNFKEMEDAVQAKKDLNGVVVRGRLPLQIEFAKTARPSRHVFVGGISALISKQQLESEFQRYGRIEDFRINREKNCAHVDFAQQSDAIAAVEGLNGKVLGNEVLRVEYGRMSGKHAARDAPPPAGPRSKGSDYGAMEHEPSEVLWIGHPLYLKVSDAMLQREFEPFGELARVRSMPGKTFSFVQFLHKQDAIRAKNALQGRLFNDDRVQIKFTENIIAPDVGGHGSFDRGVDEYRTRGGRESWEEKERHRGGVGGAYDSRSRSDVRAGGYSADYTRGRGGAQREDEWGERYPPAGIDDGPPPYHDAKRPRLGFSGEPPAYREPGRYEEERDGAASRFETRGAGAPSVQSPVVAASPWVGALAKGGTFVCRARAFTVGRGIDNPLPEVINCTARTDLDVLARHIRSAPDFGVVALVPVDNPDIPPYEDFVAYLGEKRRAGVAKCMDGSTLFLVPPSDFSQDVLRIPQRDALFGVVILSQPNSASQPPPQGAHPSVGSPGKLPSSSTTTSAATSLPASITPEVLASLSSFLPQGRHSGSQQVGEAHALAVSHPSQNQVQPQYAAVYPPPQQHASGFTSQPQVQSGSSLPLPLTVTLPSSSQVPLDGQGQSYSQVPHLPSEQLAQLSALLSQKQTQRGQEGTSAPAWTQTVPLQNRYPPTTATQDMMANPAMPNVSATQESGSTLSHPQSNAPYSTVQGPPSQPQGQAVGQTQEGGDSARFQATLQLAAALLQQMQKQPQNNSS